MKKIYISLLLLVALSSCSLNRFPETSRTEENFWQTDEDFLYAANRMYHMLQSSFTDTRADDLTHNNYPDDISAGTRKVPASSQDWTYPYTCIFTANRIIDHEPQECAPAIRRYAAEARFFRAYNYFLLYKKYGGVPLLRRSAKDSGDTILYQPRATRQEVLDFIISDLQYAAEILPKPSTMKGAGEEYGRVSSLAATALISRVALYEGTRAKFHEDSDSDYRQWLSLAATSADEVIRSGEYALWTVGGQSSAYKTLFEYDGEGWANAENIFVKQYGFNDNQVITHNNVYQLAVNYGPTRNVLNLYSMISGLPYVDNTSEIINYNDYFIDRDPRMAMTFLKVGESTYTLGAFRAYANSRTGFGIRKFVKKDFYDQPSTLDFPLMRYAEVLLNYAEAVYESSDEISDADLARSVNLIRSRVGMPALTNQFITENGLSMREELRRERTVELMLEGFRYDDLIRWKEAQRCLPVQLLGAKYTNTKDWAVSRTSIEDKMTSDDILIVEDNSARVFDPTKDYLYPIPSNDIATSRGLIEQNPNWK